MLDFAEEKIKNVSKWARKSTLLFSFRRFLRINNKHHKPDELHCIASLVTISNQFDHISVSYVQETAQKQPKIVPLLV